MSAEVTFHILEPCIGVIGPGAGEGKAGRCVRTRLGAYDAGVVSSHASTSRRSTRDIRRPASSAIEGTTTGFASRSGAKAVT